MRIAYSHHTFFGQKYGGITRYFVRLVNELHQQGVGVHIFSPLYRNRYIKDLPKSTFSGTYFFDLRFRKLAKFFNNYNCTVGRIGIEKWNPDIVHETYYSDRSIAPKGCPTIVTVYDMIYELTPHEFPEAKKVTEEKRETIKRADHIICISQKTRDDLLEIFEVEKEKTSVVYLGVDRITSLSGKVTGERKVRPYLLFVGNRGSYKNFLSILHAISLSNLKKEIDLVAFGGGKFSSSEKRVLRQLGFNQAQVRQVGGNDHYLRELYRGATALIYPSLYEGFGLPPLEAMIHKCPVISSNIDVLREVIGNAAMFFDPTDPDDLRKAIESIFLSEGSRRKLIESGTQQVKKYSWHRCGEETLKVYQRIV